MKNKRRSKLFSFVLLSLAFVITILVVLTGAFLGEKYNIYVGSISQRNFKAPKEVIDEIATQRLRESARASVVNLYKHDPDVKENILSKLDNFFDEIGVMRVETTPIYNPYEQNADNTAENTEEPAAAKFGSVSIRLSDDQYNYLLNEASNEYNEFRNMVYSITEFILDIGIKEESVAKSLLSTKDEFESLDWDAAKINTGYEIVASVLEPNLAIDEEATQKAKEEKAAAVEPVVYLPGQNIVNEGEPITAEIYAVLDSLGYTDRGLADNYIPITGVVIVIFILFGIVIMYIYYFNSEMIMQKKETMLLFTLYVLCIAAARFMMNLPFQFVPVILFTMLISLLLESRLAIIMSIMMTVVCAVTINGDANFIVYFILLGIFAAIFAKYTTERNKIFPVAILVSFISGLTSISLSFLFDKSISNESVNGAVYAMLNALLTVVLCIGTLPFWEAVFEIVTPIKMLDLTNANNKLLRRLTIEAPGTYQHSLIVGNLAETAAFDIGANPTLARVGGYYHDIGKLKYPQCFSENQMADNPHDTMDPYISAQIITGHISNGIEMARENKLPKKIIDMVEQHHGTTLIKYFYYKATKLYADREINEKDFRYNVSIPQFKESAIVMLADTIEAAVRSIAPSGKTHDEVEAFVRTLIKDKLDDGQLIDSMLTIKDLDTIASSFMRVFKGMYHERIPYPKSTMAELQSTDKDETTRKTEEDAYEYPVKESEPL